MLLYNKLVGAPVRALVTTVPPAWISGTATGNFDPESGFELISGVKKLWLEPKTFEMARMKASNGETIVVGANFNRLKNFGSVSDAHNPSQPLLYAAGVICRALKHTVHSLDEDGKKMHMCSSCGYFYEE
jgi:hypothetical protein